VGEAQQRIGVGAHGPAHVDEQHDPARSAARHLAAQRGRLPAGGEQRADRAPPVDATAVARALPACAPERSGEAEGGEQAVQLLALGGAERRDVPITQDLCPAAPRRRDGAVRAELGAVRGCALLPGLHDHRPARQLALA
jgi:hypothetical protein